MGADNMAALETRDVASVNAPKGYAGLRASMPPSAVPRAKLQETHELPRKFAELERIGTTIICSRNKAVAEEGSSADYVYEIAAGSLRAVRLLSDGRRYIERFLVPGDFFGLNEGETYSHTLEVVSSAAVVRYPRRQFLRFLEGNPEAGRMFFARICRELSDAQERMLLLGRKTAGERLAAFLIDMASRAPAKAAGEVILPMNRSDIADYLGLTVETVSRSLTGLRAQRIIDLPNANRVMVLKRSVLVDMRDGM